MIQVHMTLLFAIPTRARDRSLERCSTFSIVWGGCMPNRQSFHGLSGYENLDWPVQSF